MGWVRKLRIDKDTLKKVSLNLVNKISVSLCGIFTVFLIVDLTHRGIMTTIRFEKLKEEAVFSGAQENALLSLDADINRIISDAAGRNVFSGTLRSAKTETVSPKVVKLQTDIKLVGIIWSDNPQAILEDAKQQKTYLLNAGEKIGGIEIKKVLQDKVIVANGQQEWELR